MADIIPWVLRSIWYLFSQLFKGKLPRKMFLFVVIPMVLCPVVGWLYYAGLYSGSEVDWIAVDCPAHEGPAEKAVEFLYVSPKTALFATSGQKIYSIEPRYPAGECTEIAKPASQRTTPSRSCDGIIRWRVATFPGNVRERAIAEDCDGSLTHTEYVITEDGSVWYWHDSTPRDYFDDLPQWACLFAVFGFLIGTGLLWTFAEQRKYPESE